MTDSRTAKTLTALVSLFFIICSVHAHTHLTVPLHDPVYHLLEHAQLRGLIDPLPSVKPYTRQMVNTALKQLEDSSSRLSAAEQRIFTSYIDERNREMPWWEAGRITTETEAASAEMGLFVDGVYSTAFTEEPQEQYQGFYTFLSTYLDGEFRSSGPSLSYRFSADFGVHQFDNTYIKTGRDEPNYPRTVTQYAGFTPYTFTKPWDSYRYELFNIFKYGTSDDDPAYLGFRMQPEIGTSLFNDNLRLAFSRMPRNWGLGDDSIILSGQARPFLGFEVHAKVFEWMDYSVLVGTLENDGSSEYGGNRYQQMITLKNVDMRPFPWLYIGVHEGVVWPKRFELGYINPLIFSALYQGMGGDFDNIIGGVTLGGSIPGYAELFGTWYIDEFRPESFSDFFERVRNLFSFQAGLRTVLPGVPFGSLLVQYTKIEPFVYTHPPTSVPWLQEHEGKPYQSFISDGYGIASRLDPNSDEFLVKVQSMPASRFTLGAQYQMIRHGHYGGFYDMPLKAYRGGDILPDGMEHPDWLGGDGDSIENLQKKFLQDGPYEWYHIASLRGDIDLKGILPIPLRLGLKYSYTYQFMNDHQGNRIEDGDTSINKLRKDFVSGSRNTFTVEFRVF